MEFTKEMWEKYGYVISSTYKQKVIEYLENEKNTFSNYNIYCKSYI